MTQVDLLVRPGAVEHDRRGAEVLAPVDDRHLVGELRQEDRLLHRGVAATDHDHVLVPEERRVADGAIGDAAALQRALGVEPELARARPCSHDHGPRVVGVVVDLDAERALGEVDRGHVVGDVLGAETLGLAPEVLHHLGAEDPLGVAGVVLDVARDHQLPAEGDSLDHERVQVRARSVERSGVSSGASPDDDQVSYVVVRHLAPKVWDPRGPSPYSTNRTA